MKSINTLLAGMFILVCTSLLAQPGMNYQAVVRDVLGNLLKDEELVIEVQFVQDGNGVYTEEHTVTTDAYGQFALVMGEGTPLIGGFSSVNWKLQNVEVNVTLVENGSDLYLLSSEEMNAVPYAYTANSIVGASVEIGTNATRINGSTFLTVKGNLGGSNWNGMYVDTPDDEGIPFYGFATKGAPQSWIQYAKSTHRMDVFSNFEGLSVGMPKLRLTETSSGILQLNDNGEVVASTVYGTHGNNAVIGGGSSVNGVSTLTLNPGSGYYGGMYINAPNSTTLPFYGFAVEGDPKSWMEYSSNNWILNNGGARIYATNEGRVSVNTTTPASCFHIKQRSYDDIDAVQGPWIIGPTYMHAGLRLEHNNGIWMNMNVSTGGNIVFCSRDKLAAVAAIDWETGEYRQISDSTMKKNIRPMPEVLDNVLALNGKTYLHKNGSAKTDFGFLAQDVQEVFPHLVSTAEDKLTMNYAGLSTLAIKAIQEQQLLIQELKNEINELKTQIEAK